jgi:hypothetical protein
MLGGRAMSQPWRQKKRHRIRTDMTQGEKRQEKPTSIRHTNTISERFE